METLDDLRAARKRLRFSKSGLALAAGLAKDSLQHMDSEKWNPTHRTVEAVRAAIRAAAVDASRLAGDAAE